MCISDRELLIENGAQRKLTSIKSIGIYKFIGNNFFLYSHRIVDSRK